MFANAPFVSAHCRFCFPCYVSEFGGDAWPLYTVRRGFNYHDWQLGDRLENVFWGKTNSLW